MHNDHFLSTLWLPLSANVPVLIKVIFTVLQNLRIPKKERQREASAVYSREPQIFSISFCFGSPTRLTTPQILLEQAVAK